jgi:hypothetical protein
MELGIIMGYLICEKCKGFYALKEGESAKDFESCECGGKLTYAESLDDINKNYESLKKSEICPSCEKENLPESKYCEDCGHPLYNDYNKPISSDLEETNKSMLKNFSNRNIRIIGLVVGVLIVLIPNLLINNSGNLLLVVSGGIPLLVGGFVAAFIAIGKVKDGVLNGAIVGLISCLIFLFIEGLIFLIYKINLVGFSDNAAYNAGYFLPGIILVVLICALGGFLGIVSNVVLTKKDKTNLTKSLVFGFLVSFIPPLLLLPIIRYLPLNLPNILIVVFIVLFILLGSFVAASVGGRKYVDGTFYGYFTGGISLIILYITYFLVLGSLKGLIDILGGISGVVVFAFVIGGLIGILGGLIGIFFKQRFKLKKD